MILLTTRRTKKKANDTFEDVIRLEGEVEEINPEASQAWNNIYNALKKAHQTLTKIKELKSKREK